MRSLNPILSRCSFMGLALLATSFAGVTCLAGEPSDGESAIDFNRDIRTLLFGKCVTCHGPDEEERAAGLRLDTAEGAHEDLGGYAAVIPGDADASELIMRITSDDEDLRMPPSGKGKPFTPEQVDLMRRWINQGGKYAQHWSYEKPVRPALPQVALADWPSNPIDYFALAKMEARGIEPAAPADRLTIARRVAIDLTGLPPTWKQAQAFVNDPTETAYENYVDALLASPAFGERWARVWLDLARYADSAGYADDPPRTIWAYRDYVIQALNDNMPFDQFTTQQLAGDLLPVPPDEKIAEQQLIATAFHRNTLTNSEGGTNDEEFRNAAVVDRVNTTMAVWMGTTMACAQCHTHKYDPITHEDYFSFFALFNNTADRDLRDESPRLEIWSDEQKHRQAELQSQIAGLNDSLKSSTPELEQQRDSWIKSFDQPPRWSTCQVSASAKKSQLSVDPDGWIDADHKSRTEPENDHYLLELETNGEPLTALQLQVPASQDQNFVITHINASFVPTTPASTDARYVRVELPGKKKHLHLAEIQVFAGDENVAPLGKATQISTYRDAVAARVNDGNTDGDYVAGSVQHTESASDPWVEIDLLELKSIDRVVVWNRTDGGQSIPMRLNGFVIKLLNEQRQVISTVASSGDGESSYTFDLVGPRDVPIVAAAADFQQDNFPAASTISAKPNLKSGWAVAPKQGQPHQLTLSLASPLPTVAGKITVQIDQESVHKQHLLQHFRLMSSTDPSVTQWAKLSHPVRQVLAKPRDQWTEQQLATVDAHYRTVAPILKLARAKRDRLTADLEKMKPQTSVPVMEQLPADKHRTTKIQIRGNYLSTGDTVHARTPEAFHPITHTQQPSRLDMARWLVSPENPLTARVIANRHWEQLFGIGIVETSEDFGSQGELPSHPMMLDWLAVELQESDWDLKHLIKLMVMSSTYRQSSVTSAEAIDADPNNRLLSRGPRFRVSAEMVRDQALFVSGLLSDKRFGPPVNPPQPSLGLKAAFGSKTDWTNSAGEDRYRRGLYTTWRRSSPYPSMAQFDAPNREVCVVRRIRTNTPLQALVTLNDPVYVEAAQSLARKLIAATDDPVQRVRIAFQDCLIRSPSDTETDRLLALVRESKQFYDSHSEDATELATDPLGKLPDGEQGRAAEYAAWTTAANVILNLDEMFMKR